MVNQQRMWYRLDNAAKIYPAVRTNTWSSMYRLSMTLTNPINKDFLQLALNDTLVRFPSFNVRLRRGFFWYYLEENKKTLFVQEEEGHPLIPIKKHEGSGHLLRVLYYNCRISLEVFHAVSDGTGSMSFLKTLVARYLTYCDLTIPNTNGIKNVHEMPTPDEVEDAYRRVPMDGRKFSRREEKAYQMPGMREMPHTLHVTVARMPSSSVYNAAKQMGVTVTEYMVAVFLFCLNQMQKNGKRDKSRPVKVQVPVNMRKFIPSETVRNFAFYVNVGIDPKMGNYTFEEVVQLTHHYIRYYMNPKFLYASIAPNIAIEKNLFVRAFPLFLKNIVMAGAYSQVGELLSTTVLTNLGKIDLPKEMAEVVTQAEVLLGPGKSGRSNAGMLTLGDELTLCFTRNLRQASFEKEVLHFLVTQGIHVTVSSNQE